MIDTEEVNALIQSINAKVESIQSIKDDMQIIKSYFNDIDMYKESLEENYIALERILDNIIDGIKSINSLITNQLLVEYDNIYNDIRKGFESVIDEFSSVVEMLE